MYDFFKGLRRKVGLMTLVMACVVVAGWVRSQTIAEIISVVVGDKRLYMISVDGDLHLGISQEGNNMHPGGWDVEPLSESRFKTINRYPDVDLRFRGAGLTTHGAGLEKGRINLSFAYWAIVTPLTLVSAWFLLPKRGAPVGSIRNH